MMPPELLHTSGSGLIMYMFASLRDRLGAGKGRDLLDQDHLKVSNIIQRQSERDFPRGCTRNGLIDGTKCQSSERKGNLFRLLIVAHRGHAKEALQSGLRLYDDHWKKFLNFIKMYLGMEEWFHDTIDKQDVIDARVTIASVLSNLKKYFPRNEVNTNEYRLPKMHGMTKMQTYIKLYGSGINFYGGPGEAAHKTFVKSAGQKTQRRLSEFAQQTANQYYHMILASRAANQLNAELNRVYQVGTSDNDDHNDIDDEVRIDLSGRYELILSEEVIDEMYNGGIISVKWHTNDKEKRTNEKLALSQGLIKCLHRHITECDNHVSTVIGYTRVIITNTQTQERTIFYSHPFYQGGEWYDWAMVQFIEADENDAPIERMYPSIILGFICMNGKREAVIRCAKKHLCWEDLIKHFVIPIEIGCDFDVSYVVVPIESIVHPLCVIPDDGDNVVRYFVVLPKRNWSSYFGKRIRD
jgi:hypothetical protein